MADIEQVFAGIGERLRTIPALKVHETWPDEITPPAAAIRLGGVTFDTTQSRGSDDLVVIVHLFTSRTMTTAGQAKLYGFMKGSGESSVKAAIEGDPTLNDTVMYTDVTEIREPGFAQFGEILYYGAEFVLNVAVSGL